MSLITGIFHRRLRVQMAETNDVGPIQSIGGIFAVAAGVWGFVAGSWLGALTGIVTAMAALSGLAIMKGESGTGTSEPGTTAGTWQRIGGFAAVVLSIGGSAMGGWSWGWAWAIGGYVTGMLISLIGGVMTEKVT